MNFLKKHNLNITKDLLSYFNFFSIVQNIPLRLNLTDEIAPISQSLNTTNTFVDVSLVIHDIF